MLGQVQANVRDRALAGLIRIYLKGIVMLQSKFS